MVGKGRLVDPERTAVSRGGGCTAGTGEGPGWEVREEPWVKTTLGWVQAGSLGEPEAPHVRAVAPPDILGVWSWGRGSRQAVEVAVVCAVLTGAGLCSPRAVPGGASHLSPPAGRLLHRLQPQEQGRSLLSLVLGACLSVLSSYLPAWRRCNRESEPRSE